MTGLEPATSASQTQPSTIEIHHYIEIYIEIAVGLEPTKYGFADHTHSRYARQSFFWRLR
jgi:hypothetical protein